MKKEWKKKEFLGKRKRDLGGGDGKNTGVFSLPPPSQKMSIPTSVNSNATYRERFVPCMNFVSRYSALIVKHHITNVKLRIMYIQFIYN